MVPAAMRPHFPPAVMTMQITSHMITVMSHSSTWGPLYYTADVAFYLQTELFQDFVAEKEKLWRVAGGDMKSSISFFKLNLPDIDYSEGNDLFRHLLD